MVKAIIKLKGRKPMTQYFPTVASAKKTKKFVGREGIVKIYSRGRLIR